jgi:1-acyl-sn-glycerol-3-phosphate acyltransferase
MTVTIAEQNMRHSSTGSLIVQRVLGLFCYIFFVMPYARRILGFSAGSSARRLYVCNHVSLLDTILLGGILWSRGQLPILVLGDAQVWQRTWLRSLLSSKVGFLIERGKSDRDLLRRLQAFGMSHERFNLVVFPEGTRGDGVNVTTCQPGVYTIAQAAGIPIVPISISGMQRVSSKGGRFRMFAGLRSITVEFGAEIAPEDYRPLDRTAFRIRIRDAIQHSVHDSTSNRAACS